MAEPIPNDSDSSIRDTLSPGKGRGRPTDATWSHKARVPMSEFTHQELVARAASSGVGYTQVAARMLEDAVARIRVEAERQQRPIVAPAASHAAYVKRLLAGNQLGLTIANPEVVFAEFSDGDWEQLILDSGFNPLKVSELSFCFGSEKSLSIPDIWNLIRIRSSGDVFGRVQRIAVQLRNRCRYLLNLLDRILGSADEVAGSRRVPAPPGVPNYLPSLNPNSCAG